MSGSPYAITDTPVVIEPLPVHRFDEAALQAWLDPRLPDGAAGLEVRQFQGGMSNPTFLLTLPDGTRYVLRKKPPGKLLPRAHAVDREYRVMDALRDTPVPAPRMVAYCDDPGVIGAEFYVMAHLAGRIIPPPAMDPVDRADRPALAHVDLPALQAAAFPDASCGLAGHNASVRLLGGLQGAIVEASAGELGERPLLLRLRLELWRWHRLA